MMNIDIALTADNELKMYLKNREDKMNNKCTFNITVTMNKRWVDAFCSMLKYMEYCGNVGHSSQIEFYCDGDGDFRPKFNIDCSFEQDGYMFDREAKTVFDGCPEIIFDADIKRNKA